MNLARWLIAGVLFVVPSDSQAQDSFDSILGQLLERHFGSASPERRRSLETDLKTLFQANASASAEKQAAALKKLPLVFSYATSFYSFPSEAAKGGIAPPKVPGEMLARGQDLSAQLILRYFEAGWRASPLAPADSATVRDQVSRLADEATRLLLTKVTGPFATPAVERALQGFRTQMTSELDGLFTSSQVRPLAVEEVDSILEALRTNVDSLEGPVRVDFDPGAIPKDKSGAEQRAAWRRILKVLTEAARPAWNTLEAWNPETLEVAGRLEDLRREISESRNVEYKARNAEAETFVDPENPPLPEIPRSSVRTGRRERSARNRAAGTSAEKPAPAPPVTESSRLPLYLGVGGFLIAGAAILAIARRLHRAG